MQLFYSYRKKFCCLVGILSVFDAVFVIFNIDDSRDNGKNCAYPEEHLTCDAKVHSKGVCNLLGNRQDSDLAKLKEILGNKNRNNCYNLGDGLDLAPHICGNYLTRGGGNKADGCNREFSEKNYDKKNRVAEFHCHKANKAGNDHYFICEGVGKFTEIGY